MSTINKIQRARLHNVVKVNIDVMKKIKYFMQDNENIDTIQKAIYSIMSANKLKVSDLYNMTNKEFMSAINEAIKKEEGSYE